MIAVAGTVYVLHFIDPVDGRHVRVADHAGHYVGWCGRGLASRLGYHRRGAGSRLIRALIDRGGAALIVLTIGGDRFLERKIKRNGAVPRLVCPVCRGDARIVRAASGRLYARMLPRRRERYAARLGPLLARTAA